MVTGTIMVKQTQTVTEMELKVVTKIKTETQRDRNDDGDGDGDGSVDGNEDFVNYKLRNEKKNYNTLYQETQIKYHLYR